MARALVKRPGLYVGISEPTAEQWRMVLDTMGLSTALAGVRRVVLTPEDRETIRREDLGQDEDVLVGLLAKIIAALREASERG